MLPQDGKLKGSGTIPKAQESLYDEMMKSLKITPEINVNRIRYDKCGTFSKIPLDIIRYILK